MEQETKLSPHEFNKHQKVSLIKELGIPALHDELVFVELCAGSGILSATAERHGLKVLPIDCERNRHEHFTAIYQIDSNELVFVDLFGIHQRHCKGCGLAHGFTVWNLQQGT